MNENIEINIPYTKFEDQKMDNQLITQQQDIDIESIKLVKNDSDLKNENIVLQSYQIPIFKQLLDYQYSKPLAYFLILSSQSTNISEIIDILASDDNNKYRHFFLPENCDPNNNICQICQNNKDLHVFNTSQDINQSCEMFELILNQLNTNSQQKLNIEQKMQIKLIQCQICYIQCDQNLILEIKDEKHDICLDCFKQFLKEEIIIGKVVDIKCPHCQIILSDETIKNNVDQESYKKFQKFYLNQLVMNDPFSRWCPNPNCQKVIKMKSKSEKRVTCQHCKTEICTLCNRNYHNKQSCESVLNNELKQWADKKDVQRCKKCKTLVEKISGCNHMTCQVCKYQFCWLCGSTYTQIHFFPFNPFGCPFLQYSSKKNSCVIYLIRFLILLGILILIPIALVFGGPVLAVYLAKEKCYHLFNNCSCCSQAVSYVIIFILGFILEPFIILVFALGIIPGLIYVLYIYIKEQKDIKQQSEENLRRRQLLQE